MTISSMVSGGFRILISNGLHSDFWVDNRTGVGELRLVFPRIFALAMVK